MSTGRNEGKQLFKFIHAADIHLDSPLLNLDQYDGAPVESLRVATREAFDNLIQLAIDEQVAFVLIAGDLYDKDSPDFNTPRHVREKFRELERANIQVHIIQGNHDAGTHAKRAFEALTFPDNVHVYSTKKPESRHIEELQVAIHGQGFANRSVDEDLSSNYPMAEPGYFNIGMLHTNLGGNASHDNYAPSTREGLLTKDYQYWALGHIHKRDKGIGGSRQLIHYPGNTQGRHIRETGEKGCTLVTVDDSLNISTKFRALDVWRWQQCEIDATSLQHTDDIFDEVQRTLEKHLKAADDRSLAVRVILKGQTPAHRTLLSGHDAFRDQLRRMIMDNFDDRVWLEKLVLKTKHPTAQTSEQRGEAHGELIAAIYDVTPTEDVFADVREELEKALKAIPSDARLAHLCIDLNDEATAKTLVEDACDLLAARLLDSPEEDLA